MIKSQMTVIDPPVNGNDRTISVTVDCANMREALQEFSYITAELRDMLRRNDKTSPVPPPTDEEIEATMYAAFRIGMEDIPFENDTEE